MKPVLFELGPVAIRSWGVMVSLGFIAGLFYATRAAKRKNIDKDIILNLAFYMLIAAIVGARLVYVLIENAHYFANPIDIIMIQQGGLSIHGAIIGAIIAIYFFCRANKISFIKIVDVMAPGLLIGQAIGRLGCFLTGICYGKTTDFFIRVKFPQLAGFRHPVQIYESILHVLAFLVVVAMADRLKEDSQMSSFVFMLYALIRFFLEFIRESKILAFSISYAQAVSIIIFLFSAIIFFRSKDQQPKLSK